ncbi:hypothetical protein F4823DRAFT_90753 [Ustulina deusta]|nr:hypothetical protein F4823DRAFT_90753 [Ustulina deusta]
MDIRMLDGGLETIDKLGVQLENDASDKSSSDSDSDSAIASSDDDEEESSPKKTKRKFGKIFGELKAGKKSNELKCGDYNLTDPAGLREFLNQNATILSKKSTKDMTLLHLIAEEDKDDMPPVEKMAGLIKALVQLPQNDLLAVRDTDGKTPLFCAVTNRNHKLVKIMCKAHPKVSTVLKLPRSFSNPTRSANCIHEVILKKSSSKDNKIIQFLIELADADALLARNEDNLTPLHLAVEYKRCDEGQVKVVEALVHKCPQSLDETYEDSAKGLLSPYRYLEFSYPQDKENLPEGSVRKFDRPRHREVGPRNSKDNRHSVPEKKQHSKGDQPRGPSFQSPLYAAQTPSAVPIRKYSSKFSVSDESREPTTFITRIDDSNRKQPKTTMDMDKIEKMDKPLSTQKKSRIRVTDVSVEEIKKCLRLYYLRNRSHDAAIEFLYGIQQDKQIYFDLAGISPKVTRTQMQNGLQHLAFEDVLQYVAIPAVEITDSSPAKPKSGQRVQRPDGTGRSDLKWLFNWLRDDKKVNTILKVIVEDLHEPSHSDEVIEACLTKMNVDVWDWKKRDLSPDVLHTVAPCVHTVHLYWSGNNATLRAWSEPDGLRRLTNLRRVHLHRQEGLETRARTERYIEEFKDRMKEGGRLIEVEDTKLRGDRTDPSSKGTNSIVRDPYERHRWITSMEEYASFLQTAQREWCTDLGEGQEKSPLKYPVTVAVIDDGIDVHDPMVQSRIIDGRSFCSRDEEQNLNQPYYVSGGGHGTAMAKLICKVCPNVQLYILRLDEYVMEAGKRQITAKSAAKAVRAAIAKGVDIISMSWTIERTDINSEDIKALETEIRAAANQNILMFCAAADQGAYRDRTYPAASSTKNIIKIGAAEASGAALRSVGDQALIDFIFPGHQVAMDQAHDPKVKSYPTLTGSSVATALASGLAAVILYTVQLAEVSNKSKDLRGYKSLKDHERMKVAFSQIGTTKESENKYITVWNRFTKVVKQAERDGCPRIDWIGYIRTLAVELLRSD